MHFSTGKGFIIGGTHSGCGKTTVTMGIIRALGKRGFDVNTWKSGPDYIDPVFHSFASGSICRNLDSMMLSDSAVREIFERQNGDISVIEGVMGLFDSAGPFDERGSAAHLSKLLGLPVILVIDARAMARSAAATALGFSLFDPEVQISGFILNRIGSEHHYSILRDSIESRTGIPVLGYLPGDGDFHIPERHLGLVQDFEKEEMERIFSSLAENIEKSINMDKLIAISEEVREINAVGKEIYSDKSRKDPFVRIAVARDKAFQFYYEENLDILRHRGAEIIYFSPLSDSSLPGGISAIYLGGGYPELYAKELSENKSLKLEIVRLCAAGLPVYGECGGFMYLTEGIIGKDDEFFPMLGLLPGRAKLGEKLRSLGYCQSTQKRKTILGEAGSRAMGHVFHWANLESVEETEDRIFTIEKGDKVMDEGFSFMNVLGSWIHHHFASNTDMAESFIEAADQYRKNNG